ncbi:MAG: CpaF family protein [Lachnospiraceae bacterium]|nr:CpaF family protein [Lachnospiraceae bacterium]
MDVGKCFEKLHRVLMDSLDSGSDTNDAEIRKMIDALILKDEDVKKLSLEERVRLGRDLFSSVRRLDVLQELIDDKSVTEIMVNGPHTIFIERNGRICRSERTFATREKLEDVIQQIAGRCNRVVNERSPIVDARLEDGSRVNAVIAPVALNGPILTIRQFPEEAITMERLVRSGSLTEEAAVFLRTLSAAGYSMIIGGGTSAGKTTFLNALSNYIPKEERIITIEDNAELQIQGVPNLVRLEAKQANSEGLSEVTIRDLIKSALRMRPDRIIVGEVRSGEAIDMLQAMNTGHDGSLCTIHCNSCEDAVSRLETMSIMGYPLPLPAIRRQIASGVDLIIHLGRLKDRTMRVLEISETDGMSGGELVLRKLFEWDDEAGTLRKLRELKNRRKLVRWQTFMEENGSATGSISPVLQS